MIIGKKLIHLVAAGSTSTDFRSNIVRGGVNYRF